MNKLFGHTKIHTKSKKNLQKNITRRILVFFLALVISIYGGVASFQQASAVNVSSDHSADTTWQIKSWWYYNAMTQCMATAGSWNITKEADVRSGAWFSTAFTLSSIGTSPMGTYMQKDLSGIGDDGQIDCNQNDNQLGKAALTFWGIDGVDLMCGAKILVRDNGTDCVKGNGDFTWRDAGTSEGPPFSQYVRNAIFAGSTPSLTNGQKYFFYKQSFAYACLPAGASASTSKPSGTNVYTIGDISSSKIVTNYYIGDQPTSYSVPLSANPNVSQTCGWLAGQLSPTSTITAAGLAQSYIAGCQKQYTDPNQATACANGVTNKSNIDYCTNTYSGLTDRNSTEDMSALRQACYTGQGNQGAEDCIVKLKYTTVASGLIACIKGAQNKSDSGYCAKTFYDSSKDIVQACKDGQQFANAGAALGADTSFTEDSPTGQDQATCGDTIKSLGWILCPVLSAMGGLDDAMWSFTSALLNVSPLQQTRDGATTAVYKVWQASQSIANVVLVILFLIIIFSQLTGQGVTNYGVKKTLPRLIVVAILINVSFIVMQISVDLANILGSGIYDILNGIIPNASPPNWGQLVTTILTTAVAGGVLAGAIAIAPEAALMILIPGALAALLGFLAAVLTLMFRQAVIPILAIIAPLAFAAYLLPNTKAWFDRWRKLFTAMLVLYPLAALMFGGVKLSANVIESGGEWWQTLTALIILGAPLFMLPFVVRQSNTFLDGVNKGIRGLGKRIEKPVGDWADSRKKRALANADRQDPVKFGQNPGLATRQWLRRRRQDREKQTSAYGAEAEAKYTASVGERSGELIDKWKLEENGAGAATVRASATRARNDEIKLEMDALRATPGFQSNDRTYLARELRSAIQSGEETRAAALANYLVAARGVDELDNVLSGRALGEGDTAVDLSSELHSSTSMGRTMRSMTTAPENAGVIKERRPDMLAWGSGQAETTAEASAKPGVWGLSAEDATTLSAAGWANAEKSVGKPGGMTAEIAQTIVNNSQYWGKLQPDKQEIVLRIAGMGGGASGARTSRSPSPIGSEAINIDHTPKP